MHHNGSVIPGRSNVPNSLITMAKFFVKKEDSLSLDLKILKERAPSAKCFGRLKVDKKWLEAQNALALGSTQEIVSGTMRFEYFRVQLGHKKLFHIGEITKIFQYCSLVGIYGSHYKKIFA